MQPLRQSASTGCSHRLAVHCSVRGCQPTATRPPQSGQVSQLMRSLIVVVPVVRRPGGTGRGRGSGGLVLGPPGARAAAELRPPTAAPCLSSRVGSRRNAALVLEGSAAPPTGTAPADRRARATGVPVAYRGRQRRGTSAPSSGRRVLPDAGDRNDASSGHRMVPL